MRTTMDIDPHPVSFYNTFMKPLRVEFLGLYPFFGGFFRPDHDPPYVFSNLPVKP